MIDWQEPPPFLQYMEEAETLGRMNYMAGFCESIGIVTVDRPALQELSADFDRRAIMDKTDGPVVVNAFREGADREKYAIETMMDFGPADGPQYQRRYDQAVEYLGDACGDLVIDYPSVFSLTEPK